MVQFHACIHKTFRLSQISWLVRVLCLPDHRRLQSPRSRDNTWQQKVFSLTGEHHVGLEFKTFGQNSRAGNDEPRQALQRCTIQEPTITTSARSRVAGRRRESGREPERMVPSSSVHALNTDVLDQVAGRTWEIGPSPCDTVLATRRNLSTSCWRCGAKFAVVSPRDQRLLCAGRGQDRSSTASAKKIHWSRRSRGQHEVCLCRDPERLWQSQYDTAAPRSELATRCKQKDFS